MTKIFVIDEETNVLEEMAQILGTAGHQISTFSEGRPALAALELEGADLIMLGLTFPKMDGRSFYDRVREIRSCYEVPIVIISGVGIPRAKEMMYMKGGSLLYLEKPVLHHKLMEVVEQSLFETKRRKR